MRCKHLVVVGSLFLAPSAFAAEYLSPFYTFQAGDWSGGAYREEASGRFSHCSVSGNYRSGIILALGIDRNYTLTMILGHSSWRLPEEGDYPVDIYIDGRYLGKFAGTPQDPQLLSVYFAENRTAYDQLRYGSVMSVVAAKEIFDLRLTGTARALQRVKECVDTAMALSPGSGNPFSRETTGSRETASARETTSPRESARVREVTNPFSLAQEADEDPGDAQEMIEDVLALAGIEDPRFVNVEAQDVPGLVAGWKADGVAGLVLSGEDDMSTMDAAMTSLVASFGEGCQGHYVSGSNPGEAVGTHAIKDGFGTCATADTQRVTYVTGIFSVSDAVYFVQYAENERSEIAEEYHLRLKEALTLLTQEMASAGE